MSALRKKIESHADITFRLMTRDDFSLLLKWFNAPHVKEWWKHLSNYETIEKKYGSHMGGKGNKIHCIILLYGKPIGLIQSYLVRDYEDYAEVVNLEDSVAIDIFIGEKIHLGRGLGPQIVTTFIRNIVEKNYKEALFVVASPSIYNPRSISAFKRAGFNKGKVISVAGEEGPEQLMIFKI